MNIVYIGSPVEKGDKFTLSMEIDNEKHCEEYANQDEAINVRKELINTLKEQGFTIRFL